MPDANKTDLTRRITTAAATWLDQRGFRPVETEVPVIQGWVADLAGLCYPTPTEAQSLKLIDKKPRYPDCPGRFGVDSEEYRLGMKEYRLALDEWERTYTALSAPMTAIVEVKASPVDLAQDTKWGRQLPAHLVYLAIPPSLACDESLDARWGILVLTASGDVRLHRPPQVNDVAPEQTLGVVCQIAMRRDNFTRHARFRELDRQTRQTDNTKINRKRLSKAVEVVLAILDGKPVDEAIRDSAYREAKLPKWQIEELNGLAKSFRRVPG
jgi:hypothetical protein